jgi:hypothetical protein
VNLRADPLRLEGDVRALEGERHPLTSPEALTAAADYIEQAFRAADLDVERRPFTFGGQTYFNLVAVRPGRDPGRPRVLIGAHFDSVRGTPGADDNASGVAGVLETARLLKDERLAATVEFVAFNLEELQTWTYRVGSRRYAAAARRAGVRYAGALVLEMLGYVSEAKPMVPALLFWKRIPRTSTLPRLPPWPPRPFPWSRSIRRFGVGWSRRPACPTMPRSGTTGIPH